MRVLTFDTRYFRNLVDEAAWLTLFLSPSLRRLKIRNREPTTLPDLNLFLIGSLTAGSCQTNALNQHSSSISFKDEVDRHRNEYLEATKWFGSNSMPHLTGLRSLRIPIADFEKGAHLVGLFPLLESLELAFRCYHSPAKELQKLSLEAFPCLHHLGILYRPRDLPESFPILGLKEMVSKLTSVELRFPSRIDIHPFNQLTKNTFSMMREHSPHITDLEIRLYNGPFDSRTDIPAVFCNLASQLPLQSLYLESRFKSIPSSRLNFERTGSYPLLRRLEIVEIRVWLFDIKVLAEHFPNLEYLCTDVTVRRAYLNKFRSESFKGQQAITLRLELKYRHGERIGGSNKSIRDGVFRSVIVFGVRLKF